MDKHRRTLFNASTLQDLLLPMVTITFGLQMFRILFPSLVWYLKDTVGVGSAILGIYAFATILVGFLAAALWRLAGPRLALWVTAGGLALVRLVEQFVTQPGVDLWLGMAGSALFVLFLPTWVGHLRARTEAHPGPRLAFGILLGLALDSAIKGGAGTLDLSWIPGSIPVLVVLVMVGLEVWLLVREPAPGPEAFTDGGWADALPLLALGPYLMIQAIIFQNQGWVAEVVGVDVPVAFLLVMLGNLLAVVGATWGFARPQPYRIWLALGAAVYLFLVVLGADRRGTAFAYALGLTQLMLGWGWAVLASATVPASRRGLARTTVILGLGMVLFLLLAFLYYVSMDLPIPIPRSAYLPTAAVLVGLGILFAALRTRKAAAPISADKAPLFGAIALALVPLVYWAVLGPPPVAESPAGLPVRVMTYNLHSAYNSQGRQDLEAIARVIEESGADVVALQEVSRGWLIDGSTDMAGWLSRRLGMPILFRGTTDPVWGNALLSRYPVVNHGWGPLPLAGTLLARGYLWAQFEVGMDGPFLVIATHLHHIEAEHEPRLAQVPVLLDFWNGSPLSLILGDMNSLPGFPEMDLIAQAGFIDSWAEAGLGEGLSWPAADPFERIDWIWHTPDLAALEAETIDSTASDHRPVVVTLDVGS